MSTKAASEKGHPAAPWLRWVARMGIVAEGTIYLLIGGLALAGAFDPATRPSGSGGAMSKLAQAPLGRALLALLALGLVAYVLWQLVLTVLDPECKDKRWGIKRMALRIHHLWSAGLHCVLVGVAAWQWLGYGGSGNSGQTQEHLAAMALRLPGGHWLLGGVGAGIVVFAVVQWVLACLPHKATRMDLGDTPLRLPILTLLTLGYLARGVLFGLIGIFSLHAAWQKDPEKVTGVSGALQSLQERPYGPWLLGAVAVGLVAFGLAQMAKARYRKIRVE